MRTMLIAITALLALPAWAAESPLEARVERLEKALGNQSASNLLLQVQRLQQEVQELRGQVEMQQYRINALTGGQALPPQGADQPPPPAPFPDAVQPPPSDMGGGGGMAPSPDAGTMTPPPRPIDALDLRAPALARIPSLPSPETTAGGEREAYKAAFDLLKARRNTEAQAAFRDLLARYPQGQYADSAHYWLAESSYTARDYPTALTEFENLVGQYPQSPKVAGALLKIGYIQYEQQNWSAARASLEGLTKRFPESTEARLAQSRLERMAKEGR